MARVHASIELEGNADCTEFCPIPGWQQLFAAATYTLTEGDVPRRDGILYLYEVSRRDTEGALGMAEVGKVQTTGIFDIKWSGTPIGGRPAIALAGADGSLALYTLAGQLSMQTKANEGPEGGPYTCSFGGPCCLATVNSAALHGQGGEAPVAAPRSRHSGNGGGGDGGSCLAGGIACSDGGVMASGGFRMESLGRIDLGAERMCLSVDWADSPGYWGSHETGICHLKGPHKEGEEHSSDVGGSHEPWDGDGDDSPVSGMGVYPPPMCEADCSGETEVEGCGPSSFGDGQGQGGVSPRWLALSHSDGALSAVSLSESSLRLVKTWPAHDYEAWVAAFDAERPLSLVYSGGDDCVFKGWDLRGDCSRPIFSNRKAHTMGVCSIRGSPLRPHTLATGSYDESMRIWDTRNTSAPVCTAQAGTGGGVWRIKWHPRDPSLLLAACMHAGFSVLELSPEGTLQVREHYAGHKSLGYGADWYYRGVAGRSQGWVGGGIEGGMRAGHGGALCHVCLEDVVATCSFYDRSLQLWSPATCSNV
eukprot:jgi/Mesvir1/16975/Mv15821-RA.1